MKVLSTQECQTTQQHGAILLYPFTISMVMLLVICRQIKSFLSSFTLAPITQMDSTLLTIECNGNFWTCSYHLILFYLNLSIRFTNDCCQILVLIVLIFLATTYEHNHVAYDIKKGGWKNYILELSTIEQYGPTETCNNSKSYTKTLNKNDMYWLDKNSWMTKDPSLLLITEQFSFNKTIEIHWKLKKIHVQWNAFAICLNNEPLV